VHRQQIVRIARVSQLVEIHDRLIVLRQPVQNKIGADKTGPARYQDH
jgi:hypothetical protein